jgi:hypothetical protein
VSSLGGGSEDGSTKMRKAGKREAFASKNVPKFVKHTDKDEYCVTMTARWIATEDMPLNTVENTNFQDMLVVHDADAKKTSCWKVHEKIRYFEKNMHTAISKSLSVNGHRTKEGHPSVCHQLDEGSTSVCTSFIYTY